MNIFSLSENYKSNYFSALLALFPVSFIAGNMIININLALLVLSTIALHNFDCFKIKFHFLDKIISIFFFFVLFTGIYNDISLFYYHKEFSSWRGFFATTVKSILFFKYLLFYFVIRFLIFKRLIDLKLFFISCTLSSLFVSLDIFYQFVFGKDVFGFEIIGSGRKLGGPFDDELIAGSFIQRFSLFSFFLIPIFLRKKNNTIYFSFLILMFIIFFAGIILSGNRMPLLLFVFSVFLILIFQKEGRKFLLPFFIIFSIIFYSIFKYNSEVRTNFISFYLQVTKIYIILSNQDLENQRVPQYYKEFATFYDTWLMNKYIGGGIKNFRYYCHERKNIDKSAGFICNMHPHNYYLEILTETGLVGFMIVSIIFLQTIYISFYKRYFKNKKFKNDYLITPFIFLFLIEIFPLKSTGSFFTTGNTTYLFLIFAILLGLTRQDNSIEN